MGLLDRLFGTRREEEIQPDPRNAAPPSADAQALARYRYMIQTAPPETIEQAHEEAFTKLSPEQRRLVLAKLAEQAPAHERASVEATSSEDTRALARVATRAEVREPGTVERALGGPAASPVGGAAGGGLAGGGLAGAAGMGFGTSLLGSFAAAFAGSMVAQSFFSALSGFGGDTLNPGENPNDVPEDEGYADSEGGGDESDVDDTGDDSGFDDGDFDV